MPNTPIAVSILTGFLGAGKTTLLNRLLRDPALESTAVIINEFGEVSVDHMLVEQASDGVIQLADGCLCCTVRGELVDTLAELIEKSQLGKIQPLKRIIVETTGLADPVPVLHSVMGDPVLVRMLRLDGVICVVDAVNGAATLDAHEQAVRQAAVADRIVFTKADLAEEGGEAGLRARLRAINPTAEIIDAGSGEAGVAALFECGVYNPETKSADVRRWLGEQEHAGHHHHHHDHHDDHECEGHGCTHPHHHHHHHDERVKSISLVHDKPVSFSTVEMFLDLLRSTQGEHLLRMKGVIEVVEDMERPLVIHGVQKLLHPPAWLPEWPEGPRGTRIVLIGYDLSEDYTRRLFSAFVGEPMIDTADSAALSDNPLAIAGFRP